MLMAKATQSSKKMTSSPLRTKETETDPHCTWTRTQITSREHQPIALN